MNAPHPPERGECFEQLHRLHFDDMDAFGVLHNARYGLLVERTLGALWRPLGWDDAMLRRDFSRAPDASHLVRVHHIEYLRAVHDTGELRVRLWVERLGLSSLQFGFDLSVPGQAELVAKGHRVLVHVDPETLRPSPWSEALRQYLQRHCLDDGAPSSP